METSVAVPAWSELFLSKVQERNFREAHAFKELVEVQLSLLALSQELRRRLSVIEDECVALRESNDTLNADVQKAKEAGAKSAEAAAAQERCIALQAELNQAYKENAAVSQQLGLRDSLERVTLQFKDTTSQLSEANMRCDKLSAEVAQLKAALDSAVQELNAAREARDKDRETATRLQADNQSLISRFMEEKQKVAERMNEVNAMQQDMEKKLREQVKTQELLAATQRDITGVVGSGPGSVLLEDNMMVAGSLAMIPSRATKSFQAHDGGCMAVHFPRSGSPLATCGNDRMVKLWDPLTGMLQTTLQGAKGALLDVVESIDERCILGAGSDYKILVWQTSTERVRHHLTGHAEKVVTVDISSSDFSRAASGAHDRCIKVWDLNKGFCVQTVVCHSNCNSLCITSDGTTICSGHFDGHLRFWDMRSGKSTNEVPGLHAQQVTSVSTAPGGYNIVSSGRDNLVKMLDMRTYEVKGSFRASGYRVGTSWNRACVSPDERYVAAGSMDGNLYVWNTVTYALASTLGGGSLPVQACAWSPRGRILASADKAGMVTLWE
eukprot:jgi/Chlat1/2581/Chrsp178S00150